MIIQHTLTVNIEKLYGNGFLISPAPDKKFEEKLSKKYSNFKLISSGILYQGMVEKDKETIDLQSSNRAAFVYTYEVEK